MFLEHALILASLIHARILLCMSIVQSLFLISIYDYYDFQKKFQLEFYRKKVYIALAGFTPRMGQWESMLARYTHCSGPVCLFTLGTVLRDDVSDNNDTGAKIYKQVFGYLFLLQNRLCIFFWHGLRVNHLYYYITLIITFIKTVIKRVYLVYVYWYLSTGQ